MKNLVIGLAAAQIDSKTLVSDDTAHYFDLIRDDMSDYFKEERLTDEFK